MTRLLPFLSLFILLLTTQCSPYKQVSLETNTFYNNTKVPKRIDAYDVYVHEGQKLYTLSNQTFEKDTLRGVLIEVPAASVNAHPETRQELRESRKDMHIYLSKSVEEIEETKPISEQYIETTSVAIDRKAVERVDMFAKNEKNVFARIGLIFGMVLLGGLIVFALLFAAIKGSEDAANNSDSGSDSDSGDSNSGDSGGSNSDSGCYVATMVYGSYDAPNVLVLRSFRDRFLQRFAAGRSFIRWYYANSPKFVAKHRDKKLLGTIIRSILNAFVWVIRPVFGN
jgi:hypothetical protein